MPAKLNSAATAKAMKILCKLICLSQKGPSDADAYRTLLSGTIDQIATASAVDAAAIVTVGNPLATMIGKVTTTLDGIAATAKTNVTAYLQKAMAVDMGFASGTSATTVLNQLVADMTTNNDSVAPSGDGGSNSTGVCMYFKNNFNVVLPQSESPTIPDAWITAAPV